MAYSEAQVLTGGLAHIPIVIGFFGLIQMFILSKTKPSQQTGKTKQPLGKQQSSNSINTVPAPITKTSVDIFIVKLFSQNSLRVYTPGTIY